MLGGATGAMRPLGRGKTGPSSLASSGQTLTGVEAPVWGSVQASVPPSSVSKQRCDDCPRGCSVSPFLLGHGLAWARVTSIAATVFVARPHDRWHLGSVCGRCGKWHHWTPFSAS